MNTGAKSGEVLLRARSLEIRFGGVVAASDINLDVFQDEFLAIIGQNGAGKSTFLNICTGYLTPTQGEVNFAGRDITGRSPRAITRIGIARAFQHPQLFSRHRVIDNLRYAVASRDRFWRPWRALNAAGYDADAQALLRLFKLEDVGEQLAEDTSEGTRKLLDIAMALALEPRLLLLDEPTSGVSAEEKYTIMDTLSAALHERDVTAVFVEHDMDVVRRYANRVGVWMDGKILSTGTPDEVLSDQRVLENVL